jgi:hypothetical protein
MSDTDKHCENCRFFDRGHCRRYPPQISQVGQPGQVKWVQHLPTVDHDDYCGEFERKLGQSGTESPPETSD